MPQNLEGEGAKLLAFAIWLLGSYVAQRAERRDICRCVAQGTHPIASSFALYSPTVKHCFRAASSSEGNSDLRELTEGTEGSQTKHTAGGTYVLSNHFA